MKYLIVLTLTLLLDNAFAQSVVSAISAPGVFLIGEYEDQYLALSKEHPATFMSVYHDDIDLAYRAWSNMLMDIEDYAGDLNFDIKGVKLWINLYFTQDGTISQLAFFPKPNSRNVPVEQLTAFFKNFIRNYHLPVKAEKGFQHNASAAFPTFFHRDLPETAKRD
ncbi:MAG: hypothetical protein ABIQ02_09235 [Saprospiraceae bacterium]